jgi:poly(A) polymerase
MIYFLFLFCTCIVSFNLQKYNVSASTLQLMKEELVRGAEVSIKIEKNLCPWTTLFDKCDFFSRYKVYLQVDIVAQTELEHRKWFVVAFSIT